MLFVTYAVAQALEMFFGVWVLYRLYPELRKENKWIKGIAGISYAVNFSLYVWNAWGSFVSNVFIIANSFITACFYYLFFSSSLKSVLCWLFLYNSTIALLKVPVLAMRGMLEGSGLSVANRGGIGFVQMLWCLLINIIIYIVLVKKDNALKILENLLIKHWKLLYLFSGIEFGMLTYCMWLGESGFSRGDVFLNLLIIFCMALLAAYLLLHILYQEIKNRNVMLDSLQSITETKNESVQALYTQVNQRLHDFKHVLHYLSDCISQGRIEEAKTYIDKYAEEIGMMEQKIWTGFSFLDFLLNYEKAEMDKKEIEFALAVDLYSLPFAETELGVVIGNLLDNAIEAAEKCEREKRKIFMKIGNKNEMFLLSICNSSIQKPVVKGDLFQTTKENKNVHGLGVESVKRIVNKYDGYINFQYDAEHFQVDVLI